MDEETQEETIGQDDLPNESEAPEAEEAPQGETEAAESETQEAQNEAEATAPDAAPFRPQFDAAGLQTREERLRALLGDEGFRDVQEYFSSQYAHSRQAETASDHYAGQIDAASPGFLGVSERAYLRQLPAPQQADPGAAVIAAAKRYVEKAQQTGNPVAALDEFANEWQTRRGTRTQKPPIPAPVLPPSQRVATSGGGTSRPAVSAPRGRDSEMDGAVSFLKGLGVDEAEAKRYAREL